MKTKYLKQLLSFAVFFGFLAITNAQQTKNCHSVEPKEQKACFDQLVSFNLSELIEYPEVAKNQGVEGKVYVRFTTDEFNEIQNIRILGDSNEDLSKAVIDAVYKLAAQNQSEMILANSVYRIPVNFSLNQ